MTIIQEIEKAFDKEFGQYGTQDPKFLDALETEVKFRLGIKSFLRQSIRKVVESCPETMTYEYEPDDTVTSDAIKWKSSILKELE